MFDQHQLRGRRTLNKKNFKKVLSSSIEMVIVLPTQLLRYIDEMRIIDQLLIKKIDSKMLCIWKEAANGKHLDYITISVHFFLLLYFVPTLYQLLEKQGINFMMKKIMKEIDRQLKFNAMGPLLWPNQGATCFLLRGSRCIGRQAMQ